MTGFVSGNSTSFAGITNSFSYNQRLQPVNMSASSPSATVFSLNYDFHLSAGNNGNVFGIVNNKDTSRNQTFAYDALNRLTSAQNAGTDCSKTLSGGKTEYWGNNYSYDAWGNLLAKTPTKCSAENLSLTALANNQLSGYGYDAAGNMTHHATSGFNYSYDQENRIAGAGGFAYTYDAEGNRVEKSNGTSPSSGTLYWYMASGIVAESDLSGNLQSEYVFFDGERVARRDLPSNAVSYYFSDRLKTTNVVIQMLRGTSRTNRIFIPGWRTPFPSERLQSLQVHRQRTGLRNRPRLLRGTLLLQRPRTVHHAGTGRRRLRQCLTLSLLIRSRSIYTHTPGIFQQHGTTLTVIIHSSWLWQVEGFSRMRLP
jgi:hypothetical protein